MEAFTLIEIGQVGADTYYYKPHKNTAGETGVLKCDYLPFEVYRANVTLAIALLTVWQIAERHNQFRSIFNAI